MNTSIRFMIPTIFLSLGVCLISCNDEITSAGNSPSTSSYNPTFTTIPPIPTYPFIPTDPSIGPKDLSKRIKDINEKIERLEKESEFHHNEFYNMVGIQKEISNEVKRKRTVMKSKPIGSEDRLKAQKEFENQKKLGKERLKIIKEKNLYLSQLTKSITEAKNEQIALQKIQEDLQKDNKSTNKNENTDKTTTQDDNKTD